MEKKSGFSFSLGTGISCVSAILGLLILAFVLTHLTEIWTALEKLLELVTGE